MFHIILILIGAIQAERVFYSVPHHMGYFEKVDPDEYDIFVSSNEFHEDIGQSEIFIFGQKNWSPIHTDIWSNILELNINESTFDDNL